MQRRQFIKNLAGVFVAAAAPSIFVPTLEPPKWKRPRKIKATWSCELEQDLRAFHGIDPTHELSVSCVRDHLRDYSYNPIILSSETIDGSYRDNWWKFPTPPIKMVEISYL